MKKKKKTPIAATSRSITGDFHPLPPNHLHEGGAYPLSLDTRSNSEHNSDLLLGHRPPTRATNCNQATHAVHCIDWHKKIATWHRIIGFQLQCHYSWCRYRPETTTSLFVRPQADVTLRLSLARGRRVRSGRAAPPRGSRESTLLELLSLLGVAGWVAGYGHSLKLSE